MKNYIFIAMAMLWHSARAQEDAQPTIYFNTGKIITAEKIRLRTGVFNDLYLLADGKRIQAEQVKFFQNHRGFFANIQNLHPLRESGFAERTDQGRINLYEAMSQRYDWEVPYHGYQLPAEREYNIDLFYNKGLEDLKKVNYTNLSVDLQDNPQSLDFLAVYRKKRSTANIFFGAAGVSLIAGLVSLVNKGAQHSTSVHNFSMPSRPKTPYLGFALLGVGSGFGLAGTLNYAKSKRELINAIDAYNR
jgi:hypothetical protein